MQKYYISDDLQSTYFYSTVEYFQIKWYWNEYF
jgi:hypothetical protein